MADDETSQRDEKVNEISQFLSELAKEGERSAVVLGASRADTALEELLRRFMQPHPGGNDNLFDPDRPLGTFSAKIVTAFRLGLIDRCCEHALQMLRKIRNEFAHSTVRASLSESRHKSRVAELVIEASKYGPWYDRLYKAQNAISSHDLRAFCASTIVFIALIEFTAEMIQEVSPSHVVDVQMIKAALAKSLEPKPL